MHADTKKHFRRNKILYKNHSCQVIINQQNIILKPFQANWIGEYQKNSVQSTTQIKFCRGTIIHT